MKKVFGIIGILIEVLAAVMVYYAIWNVNTHNFMQWFLTIILTGFIGGISLLFSDLNT